MAAQIVNNFSLPIYNGDGCPKIFLRDFKIKSDILNAKSNKVNLLKQCLEGKVWDLFVTYHDKLDTLEKMENFLCKNFQSHVESYYTHYERITNRKQAQDQTFDSFVTDLKVMWTKMVPDRSNVAGLDSSFCEMVLVRNCIINCRPEIREKLPLKFYTESLEELADKIREIEEDLNRPRQFHDVSQNETFSTPTFNPFSIPPPVLTNVPPAVPTQTSAVHASPRLRTPVNRFRNRDRNHPYSDRSNSNNSRFNLRPRRNNISFGPNNSKNGQSPLALMPPH